MYWGQIAIALAFSFISGYVTIESGRSPTLAALVAILTYILTRWMIAWFYRIRFWYQLGEKGSGKSCPDCGGYIYRQGGDWILECKRCGWTAGWPGIRWLTSSVPAKQLRRTVIGPKLVVVVIVIALIASGAPGGVISGTDENAGGLLSAIGDNDGSEDPLADTQPTQTSSEKFSTANGENGYDNAKVRQAFLSRLNEERTERGLQTLSLRSELTEMGEDHAANMAEHDYIGHEWPDGTTIQDRYRSRGLLPECRLKIDGSNRYYPGAENAAGAWVDRRFQSSGGSYYVSNEQELGQTLFEIWLSSPPHRQAMLVQSADEMGLGINITNRGKVYAALELC